MSVSPSRLKLSVLDQSPVSEGADGAQALRESVELAKWADALGYHRYWVAEHHGTPMLACASPEVLLGPIGMVTRRLRLGSGGVMLPHYSPLKVAESFSLLSGLFPGRVDLALGRAPGSDGRTAFALQRDRRQRLPEDFPEQLAELTGYLDGTLPADHPFARLARDLPGQPEKPELWLLGSSLQSALWAGEWGLPYAFADFINPAGETMAQAYRDRFRPSSRLAAPHQLVAVAAICAETDEAAERLAASWRMVFTLFLRGQLIKVPEVATALKFLAAEGLDPAAAPPGRRAIVGSPRRVREQIESVAAEYQAREAMVVTIVHDPEARRRSYELLAREFGLVAE